MMRRRWTTRLVGLLLVVGTVALVAQEPTEDVPTARFEGQVEVIEVLVDVLAIDRRGNVITGLTKDDFVVEEGRKPKEITSVTFYATRYQDLKPGASRPEAADPAPTTTDSSSSDPKAIPAQIPASRYFILFFHDQAGGVTNESQLARMRLTSARDARQWIAKEMGPADWFSVVRFDFRLSVHADFTQDRDEVIKAIDSATLNKRPEVMKPSTRRRLEAGPGPSLLRNMPSSFDLSRSSVRAEDAVRIVAEATRPIIGRKNMVLFTLGFARLDSPLGDPDSRYYPAMEESLNDNNIAVYPIDLSGSGNQSAQNHFLSRLADDTGGVYYATFNRFLQPLTDITRKNTGYYLISFRTEVPAGEIGYNHFRVKSTKKGVRVKARRGYRYGN